jgi:hypothetical protein
LGAEAIVVALLSIPIIAAYSIVRRERLAGPDRPQRPFWVTLGIAVAIAIPAWAVASILIRALTSPD